jgi:hypothetical protein
MAIQVKFRRGSSGQHSSFTGANGEITIDTTNKTIRVHDGVTVGGTRLAKLNEIITPSAVTESLIPSANVTYDLGSSNRRWRSLYLSNNTIFLGTAALTIGSNNNFIFTSNNQPAKIQASQLIVTANTPSSFEKLTVTNLVLRTVLGTQYGGTGLSSLTKNGVLFGSTASRIGFITGTVGSIMQISSNGTPSFAALDGGSYT